MEFARETPIIYQISFFQLCQVLSLCSTFYIQVSRLSHRTMGVLGPRMSSRSGTPLIELTLRLGPLFREWSDALDQLPLQIRV